MKTTFIIICLFIITLNVIVNMIDITKVAKDKIRITALAIIFEVVMIIFGILALIH